VKKTFFVHELLGRRGEGEGGEVAYPAKVANWEGEGRIHQFTEKDIASLYEEKKKGKERGEKNFSDRKSD